jgi:hypothetical protein
VPASRIVILTALASEARAVRAALRGVAHAADVLVIGPRAAFLPAAGDLADASFIIVAGLAGALDPALRPGDTIIDGLPKDSPLPRGCRLGQIHTSASIVGTLRAKSDLFRVTGASVVEMEHAVVRDALPGAVLVGIRTVLDPADETLPLWLAGLVNDRGRARPAATALRLVLAPTSLTALARVAHRSRIALPALGRAVVTVLTQLPDHGPNL